MILAALGGRVARRMYVDHLYRQAGIAGRCRGAPNGRCSADIWHEVASASPAFDSYPWADEFWREMRSHAQRQFPYEPFLVWGDSEFRGRYLNVERTATGNWRKTPSLPTVACSKHLEVWMFGGSTVFGYGMPDAETLPSNVQRELSRRTGACVTVSNFGIEGFTSSQSLTALLLQLRAGGHPDLVIDYEGVNDATAGGYSPGVAGGHLDMVEIKTKFEQKLDDDVRVWASGNDLARGVLLFGRKLWGDTQRLVLSISADDRIEAVQLTEGEIQRRAAATVENYGRNVALLQMLSRAYGFKAYSFWHPVLYYGRRPGSPFEKAVLEVLLHNADHATVVAETYKIADRRAAELGFVSLAHAVDELPGTVYLDTMHLGPEGNRLVATRIAEKAAGD
ncbi:MAG: SGNH/GDSL hydrolase family protein [Acidobacteriota bacterium]|nr:SGNH/GDSL hydrolase family protein [Acidobacteriota bacterium]